MNDLLGLLAEIAVGFTGFAAIVSALGQAPSDADARLDRLRLRNLVEMGVVIVAMATLPLVLVLGLGETRPDPGWTVCALLLLTALVSFVFIHGGRNRAARVSELEGYSVFVGLAAPSAIRLQPAYVTAPWLMTVMLGLYFIRVAVSLLTHKLGGDA